MKRTTVIALVVALVWLAAGCSEPLIRPESDAADRIEPAERDTGTMQSAPSDAESGEADESGDSGGAVKAFAIRATKYEFDVREIRVKQGDTVELALENAKGYHTLKLEGYNLEAKKNRPITFVATEKGEFTFRCGVVCGSGHEGMTGKLIVE